MTGDVAFGSSAGLVVGVGPCSYATAVGARQVMSAAEWKCVDLACGRAVTTACPVSAL